MQVSNDDIDRLNLQCTYGALCFGVPSGGMDVRAMASIVGDLPSRFTLGLLDEQIGHQFRQQLHEDFCNAFDYQDSKITSLYELRKSPTVREVCNFYTIIL